MFRRLLTCLALITGLAAAGAAGGAPANAAMMDALSEQVSASSAPCQQANNAPCECVVQPATSPSKGDPVKVCRTRKPMVVYIPTIHFGADRAYE